MGQKQSWINQIAEIVIQYYQDGHSAAETARFFGGCCDKTVLNLLIKYNIPRRGKGDGKRWTEENRENQSQLRKGKPSPAKGKTWTIDHAIEHPNLRGEKNPNWRGGKTEISLAIRSSAPYISWRKAVFQRDDYTCVLCGARRNAGDRVVVHADHIIPLSVLINQYHIETIEDARQCAELWDTSNGRTLCVKCHKSTDTYGLNLARHTAT